MGTILGVELADEAQMMSRVWAKGSAEGRTKGRDATRPEQVPNPDPEVPCDLNILGVSLLSQ